MDNPVINARNNVAGAETVQYYGKAHSGKEKCHNNLSYSERKAASLALSVYLLCLHPVFPPAILLPSLSDIFLSFKTTVTGLTSLANKRPNIKLEVLFTISSPAPGARSLGQGDTNGKARGEVQEIHMLM